MFYTVFLVAAAAAAAAARCQRWHSGSTLIPVARTRADEETNNTFIRWKDKRRMCPSVNGLLSFTVSVQIWEDRVDQGDPGQEHQPV